jgi:predicted TIM-barrel fold metal-dependent hydrolase
VCSYADWRAATDELLAGLDAAAREQILAQTARSIYGI